VDIFELRVTRPDGRQMSASHAMLKEEQDCMPASLGVRLRVNEETIVLPHRVLRGMLRLLEDPE